MSDTYIEQKKQSAMIDEFIAEKIMGYSRPIVARIYGEKESDLRTAFLDGPKLRTGEYGSSFGQCYNLCFDDRKIRYDRGMVWFPPSFHGCIDLAMHVLRRLGCGWKLGLTGTRDLDTGLISLEWSCRYYDTAVTPYPGATAATPALAICRAAIEAVKLGLFPPEE